MPGEERLSTGNPLPGGAQKYYPAEHPDIAARLHFEESIRSKQFLTKNVNSNNVYGAVDHTVGSNKKYHPLKSHRSPLKTIEHVTEKLKAQRKSSEATAVEKDPSSQYEEAINKTVANARELAEIEQRAQELQIPGGPHSTVPLVVPIVGHSSKPPTRHASNETVPKKSRKRQSKNSGTPSFNSGVITSPPANGGASNLYGYPMKVVGTYPEPLVISFEPRYQTPVSSPTDVTVTSSVSSSKTSSAPSFLSGVTYSMAPYLNYPNMIVNTKSGIGLGFDSYSNIQIPVADARYPSYRHYQSQLTAAAAATESLRKSPHLWRELNRPNKTADVTPPVSSVTVPIAQSQPYENVVTINSAVPTSFDYSAQKPVMHKTENHDVQHESIDQPLDYSMKTLRRLENEAKTKLEDVLDLTVQRQEVEITLPRNHGHVEQPIPSELSFEPNIPEPLSIPHNAFNLNTLCEVALKDRMASPPRSFSRRGKGRGSKTSSTRGKKPSKARKSVTKKSKKGDATKRGKAISPCLDIPRRTTRSSAEKKRVMTMEEIDSSNAETDSAVPSETVESLHPSEVLVSEDETNDGTATVDKIPGNQCKDHSRRRASLSDKNSLLNEAKSEIEISDNKDDSIDKARLTNGLGLKPVKKPVSISPLKTESTVVVNENIANKPKLDWCAVHEVKNDNPKPPEEIMNSSIIDFKEKNQGVMQDSDKENYDEASMAITNSITSSAVNLQEAKKLEKPSKKSSNTKLITALGSESTVSSAVEVSEGKRVTLSPQGQSDVKSELLGDHFNNSSINCNDSEPILPISINREKNVVEKQEINSSDFEVSNLNQAKEPTLNDSKELKTESNEPSSHIVDASCGASSPNVSICRLNSTEMRDNHSVASQGGVINIRPESLSSIMKPKEENTLLEEEQNESIVGQIKSDAPTTETLIEESSPEEQQIDEDSQNEDNDGVYILDPENSAENYTDDRSDSWLYPKECIPYRDVSYEGDPDDRDCRSPIDLNEACCDEYDHMCQIEEYEFGADNINELPPHEDIHMADSIPVNASETTVLESKPLTFSETQSPTSVVDKSPIDDMNSGQQKGICDKRKQIAKRSKERSELLKSKKRKYKRAKLSMPKKRVSNDAKRSAFSIKKEEVAANLTGVDQYQEEVQKSIECGNTEISESQAIDKAEVADSLNDHLLSTETHPPYLLSQGITDSGDSPSNKRKPGLKLGYNVHTDLNIDLKVKRRKLVKIDKKPNIQPAKEISVKQSNSYILLSDSSDSSDEEGIFKSNQIKKVMVNRRQSKKNVNLATRRFLGQRRNPVKVKMEPGDDSSSAKSNNDGEDKSVNHSLTAHSDSNHPIASEGPVFAVPHAPPLLKGNWLSRGKRVGWSVAIPNPMSPKKAQDVEKDCHFEYDSPLSENEDSRLNNLQERDKICLKSFVRKPENVLELNNLEENPSDFLENTIESTADSADKFGEHSFDGTEVQNTTLDSSQSDISNEAGQHENHAAIKDKAKISRSKKFKTWKKSGNFGKAKISKKKTLKAKGSNGGKNQSSSPLKVKSRRPRIPSRKLQESLYNLSYDEPCVIKEDEVGFIKKSEDNFCEIPKLTETYVETTPEISPIDEVRDICENHSSDAQHSLQDERDYRADFLPPNSLADPDFPQTLKSENDEESLKLLPPPAISCFDADGGELSDIKSEDIDIPLNETAWEPPENLTINKKSSARMIGKWSSKDFSESLPSLKPPLSYFKPMNMSKAKRDEKVYLMMQKLLNMGLIMDQANKRTSLYKGWPVSFNTVDPSEWTRRPAFNHQIDSCSSEEDNSPVVKQEYFPPEEVDITPCSVVLNRVDP